MACNFIKVGKSDGKCQENYSGVGGYFYLFKKDGQKNPSVTLDSAPAFTLGSFDFSQFVKVTIKSQSGKVTSSSNPNGGGFNNVYTCVVPKDMEKMSAVASVMNNTSDWGVAVPTGQKETLKITSTEYDTLSDTEKAQYQAVSGSSNFYETKKSLREYIVLWNNDFDIEFSMESDTGDAPDSDHGHTLTITQSNMLYALQKWYSEQA